MTARKSEGRKRMGRPPKSTDEALRNRVVVHLRDADFEALKRWAKERGAEAGEVAREVLERAIRRKK